MDQNKVCRSWHSIVGTGTGQTQTDATDVLTRRIRAVANDNKAFIDIRLRPAIATQLAMHRHTAHYGQTWRHP